MADPGEGSGGPDPLLLDQTEARRGEKKFLGGDRAPRYLGGWKNAPPPPPPPYLKVWIRHCQRPENLDLWLA